MAYTSWDEIKALFPRVEVSSLTESSVGSYFIPNAEAFVNQQLGRFYSLPFSATPPIVKAIAQNYCMYLIGRRFFSQGTKDSNKWVDEFKKDAYDLIASIVYSGSPLLDNSLQVISMATDREQIWSNTMDYTPTMDSRNPVDQHVDPDRLDDEDDADDT